MIFRYNIDSMTDAFPNTIESLVIDEPEKVSLTEKFRNLLQRFFTEPESVPAETPSSVSSLKLFPQAREIDHFDNDNIEEVQYFTSIVAGERAEEDDLRYIYDKLQKDQLGKEIMFFVQTNPDFIPQLNVCRGAGSRLKNPFDSERERLFAAYFNRYMIRKANPKARIKHPVSLHLDSDVPNNVVSLPVHPKTAPAQGTDSKEDDEPPSSQQVA